MAVIPYLYRRMVNLGVPPDIAVVAADTEYDGEGSDAVGNLSERLDDIEARLDVLENPPE